jgi:hypothetical protein
MCVMSMVHDFYTPKFEPYVKPNQTIEPLFTFGPDLTPHLEEIKQLIKDFRAASEAALKVDRLTDQPDCVDPAKAKLEAKIAELEAEIARLTKKPAKKTKKRTNKKGK